MFYNHLIHEVKATKQKVGGTGSYRLYCGIRASSNSKTPFDYRQDIIDQAVPILPSGDRPPIYSTRHLAFFKERLITSLKSLSQENTSIAMYPKYTAYEIQIMLPHRL